MTVKRHTISEGPVDMKGSWGFPCGRGSGFVNLHGVHARVFGKDTFLIIAHGAFDAMGLIGHEGNGIAIAWANKGVLLIDGHLRRSSNPTGRVSPRQVVEYARIARLGRDEFRDFVNSYPGVRYRVLVAPPRPIVKAPRPDPAAFSATPYDTAGKKVRDLRALLRFVVSGFDRLGWNRRVYRMLHTHFGHIAHDSLNGFYEARFGAIDDRIAFLESHRDEAVPGGPGANLV